MEHAHSRAATARAVAALAALLLAGGCGMYGDLYLEEPVPPPAPAAEGLEPDAGDAAPAAQQPDADEDRPGKPKPAPPEAGEQATGRP